MVVLPDGVIIFPAPLRSMVQGCACSVRAEEANNKHKSKPIDRYKLVNNLENLKLMVVFMRINCIIYKIKVRFGNACVEKG